MPNGDAPRYLIPRPLRRGFEFFPGWDGRSVGLVAAGLGAGAAVAALGNGLGALSVGLVAGILVAGGMAALAVPPPTGEPPLVDRLQAFRAYRRRPHRFVFDWPRPDL